MDEPESGAPMKASEVAARLGVTERTVYSYVERGLLAATRVRRGLVSRITFTAKSVEECRRKLEDG